VEFLFAARTPTAIDPGRSVKRGLFSFALALRWSSSRGKRCQERVKKCILRSSEWR
jgi:hypothetical protein